ncbi:MAG TPA: MTAP family purine nucleoside phosphorylase [Sphaerochaeta sp.]|jgi:purine nucleoside phosphorylase|nr:MTAP family purine nucleoside phosphorylase [Sphaerochaeta sp.]HQB54945.1 MTAP family purine nucleoside phosphorylase [Sphaerochaeta sp.]
MKAIIGGTGFDRLEGLSLKKQFVETPYGGVELFLGQGEDEGLVFLPRHGASHGVPPHRINYRAHALALKQIGVVEAIAIYAVGSIDNTLEPGEVGIVRDFVDFTGRSQEHTLFDRPVTHIEVNKPFDEELKKRMLALKPTLADAGVYVTTNGPRLETKAEIAFFKRVGFSIVGMTLASEVTVLLEVGIRTLALAYSINWAAGVVEEFSFLPDSQLEVLKTEVTQLCRSCLLS